MEDDYFDAGQAQRHAQSPDGMRTGNDMQPEEGSGRISATTVLLILIIVAAIANIGVLIARDRSYSIESWLLEQDMKLHQAEYERAIDSYLDEQDYIALRSYVSAKDLAYTESFAEYGRIFDAANAYVRLVEGITILQGDYAGYLTDSEAVARVASGICDIYQVKSWYEAGYLENAERTGEAIDGMIDQINALLAGCFGISEEECGTFETMEQHRIEMFLGKRSGIYE